MVGVVGCCRCRGSDRLATVGVADGRAVVLNWSATVGDGRRCQVLPVLAVGIGTA